MDTLRPPVTKNYSAVGHQSEQIEHVEVLHHVPYLGKNRKGVESDVIFYQPTSEINSNGVETDIIFQPASGITLFHSYLLIRPDLSLFFFFQNDVKSPNRSQLLLQCRY